MSEFDAGAQLRKEVGGLPVDEILALCYSLHRSPERLRMYADVLRSRGGQRAQFASCLICFDLARQGDESFQREFAYLAGTLEDLAQNNNLVETMVGDDPYLTFIWELMAAQLQEMDERFGADHASNDPLADAAQDLEDVGAIELLDDTDFDDFDIPVDHAQLQHQFFEAVERFLGTRPGIAAYDPRSGFRMRTRRDVERVEEFLLELDSLRELVPLARGYRALVLLFYGTHLRSKGLFGAINERKQIVIREGLREFMMSGQEVWHAMGVLGPLHAGPSVWAKIGEILVDYTRWMARQRGPADPERYDAVERQIERDRQRRRFKRRRGGR